MAVDLALLRMLKHKADFRRVFGRIPDAALNKETKAILDDYSKYFERFPDHESIDMDVFMPMFRVWHSTLSDERRSIFELALENAKADVTENVRAQVMRQVLELRLATEVADIVARFDAGDLSNIAGALANAERNFKLDTQIEDDDYLHYDISKLLELDKNDEGIRWRLDCLNAAMRPLRPGDFGIIAGRPDRGKTSFIASELSFMAKQLPPEKNILWLNNEGVGSKIYPRLYQAALGATIPEILILDRANALVPAYLKQVGRYDRIRIKDIHGRDNFAVEQIIEANNAGIVVYDMIDNIHGFPNSSRTDQRLEEMYKWARETAVSMGHIGLATSQISNEGENIMFPPMSMLKDSKTGKQGACDFQIMIGSKNDPGYSAVRWISIPKNKLRRVGSPGDPRSTVKFDAERARFSDLDMPIDEPAQESK